MYKLASIIVKGRKIFTLLFIGLIIFSIFSFSWVNIEEEISAYLNEDSDTRRGLDVMGAEFVSYGSSTVLVRDISDEDAAALCEEIQARDNICLVTYETSDKGGRNDALFTVIYTGRAGDPVVSQAEDDLQAMLSDRDSVFTAETVVDYVVILAREMSIVLVLVVIIVIAVLLLTSSTYTEIAVLLLTFITAAVINMGTNFIMGTISFVSNAVAVVLQLALSVDYAIILCNRYKEEHETKDIEESAICALAYSIPAISASSLTTIAGLGAMTFMKFSLGLDMGIALIKAIAISLFSVFMFMPALLVFFGKSMDRTKHRNFVPNVDFVGRFAYKTRFIIPFVFLGFLALGYFGFSQVQYAFDDTDVKVINITETKAAQIEAAEKFGNNNPIVLIVPSGNYTAEADFIKQIEAMPKVKNVLGVANIDAVNGYKLSDYVNYKDFMGIADVDETTAKALFAYYAASSGEAEKAMEDLSNYKVSIIDLFVELHDVANSGEIELEKDQMDMINGLYGQLTMALDQLEGDNYSAFIVYADIPLDGQETFDFLTDLKTMATERFGEDIYVTGNPVASKDFASTFEVDTRTVTVMSIVLVMVILFFTFKTPFMPILLMLVIQGSIWLNFAIAAWSGDVVFFMCYLIVSSIQMGANIDYAIVISTRYTEMRDNGLDQREAVIKTVNLAFPTVITSGTMMVVAGLLIGIRVSEPIIAGMGYYVGTGTIITLILVNFVLPQILLFGDKIVRATTFTVSITPRKRRVLAYVSAAIMLVASILAAVLTPNILSQVSSRKTTAKTDSAALSETLSSLRAVEAELASEDIQGVSYSFAEAMVTEDVGSKQLAEGQQQYDEGKKQLDDAKAQYEDGQRQYEEGMREYQSYLAEYASGKAQLESAMQQFAEGQAEYEDGLAEYEQYYELYLEGKAEFEAGEAEYNDGVAQLAEARLQLAAGEAAINALTPAYETTLRLNEDYLELEADYQEAVDSGDTLAQFFIYPRYQTAKNILQSALDAAGYSSVEEMTAEYNAGLAELEDGRAQIADGEAQLAEAKVLLDEGRAELQDGERQLKDAQYQLESGRAQLDDAERQINEGQAELASGAAQLSDAQAQLSDAETQLSDAKVQISDGEAQLNDAKLQLDDGRSLLNENKDVLYDSLKRVNSIKDNREMLKAGVRVLLGIKEISDQVEDRGDYKSIFDASDKYLSELSVRTARNEKISLISMIALYAAAVMAVIAYITFVNEKYSASRIFALIACAGGLLSVILCAASSTVNSTVFPLAAALVLAPALLTLLNRSEGSANKAA